MVVGQEVRTPRVQDGKEPDLGAQPFWIPSDFEQRLHISIASSGVGFICSQRGFKRLIARVYRARFDRGRCGPHKEELWFRAGDRGYRDYSPVSPLLRPARVGYVRIVHDTPRTAFRCGYSVNVYLSPIEADDLRIIMSKGTN